MLKRNIKRLVYTIFQKNYILLNEIEHLPFLDFILANDSVFGTPQNIPNVINVGMKGVMSLFKICRSLYETSPIWGDFELEMCQNSINNVDVVYDTTISHNQNKDVILQYYADSLVFLEQNLATGADVFFFYAFAFCICHELGHILYNNENEGNPMKQEWRSDNFAIEVILHGDEIAQPNVGLARPIGLLMGTSLPLLLGERGDNTHPDPITRIANCYAQVVESLADEERSLIRDVKNCILGYCNNYNNG